jgi:glycine/D-amino acid oxidase-like deaminating enzyme
MSASITIVGQGLAGTLLGWELERNGAAFQIIDEAIESRPEGACASKVAAGLVNPITGQRIVKSWRVDELLPLARETYRSLERAWGVDVWRDLRVRRLWRNEDERRVFATKQPRGELAPFAGEADDQGFWIEGAGYVDVPTLLAAARQRWRASRQLVEKREPFLEIGRDPEHVTIWCTGAALRERPPLASLPATVAKGELLEMSVEGLDPAVVLNRGHWVLPTTPGRAKAGATYTPGASDVAATSRARAELEQSAREILSRDFLVTAQQVGLRLTLLDKRPIVGRLPGDRSKGVFGGLGSKGVLLAPWLARQWWNHLSEGVPFDPTVDVARCVRGR